MARLLVSVRNAYEAELAIAGGADLIDLKEPDYGSLGAADADTIEDVIRMVDQRVPVSVALGELLDGHRRVPPESLAGAKFAKLGLSRCLTESDWKRSWALHVERLPRGTCAVAVVYADAHCAQSPPAQQIIHTAQQLHCAAVLVDTFDKRTGPLDAVWTRSQIRNFILEVQQRGLLAVVAGSLTCSSIQGLLPLEPDIFAVRGAVCRTTRTSPVEAEKVTALKALLSVGNPRQQISLNRERSRIKG